MNISELILIIDIAKECKDIYKDFVGLSSKFNFYLEERREIKEENKSKEK